MSLIIPPSQSCSSRPPNLRNSISSDITSAKGAHRCTLGQVQNSSTMPATPAFVPPDLSAFEFPPRLPLIQSNPYEKDSELNGFPSHSSRLLWAIDRSVVDLAIELYLVDQGEHIYRASSYANQVPEVVYGHLTNMFFTTSVQFLRLAVKQQLHTCFKSPNDKSLRLPNDVMSYSQSKEIPGVYSLVHCKADGTTPSSMYPSSSRLSREVPRQRYTSPGTF